MWSNARNILLEFKSQSKTDNTQQEKDNIIRTAVKLIKNDIKLLDQPSDTYPTCAEMASEEAACDFLPNSLRSFLVDLFTGSDIGMKVASIGQSIVQATLGAVSCLHLCSLDWAFSYIAILAPSFSLILSTDMASLVVIEKYKSLSVVLQ